ncbi:MAG: TonB-dependent receptor, partial [Actinobacteria bacterium]|nr:TonB-dependent receptor [Actinomycetota bacterium]
MKNKTVQIFSLLVVLLSSPLLAQKKGTISGQVIDSATGEPVFYVNVFLENTTEGTTTDAEGFFSIRNIPPGIYNLIVQHVGYEIKVLQVHLLHQ